MRNSAIIAGALLLGACGSDSPDPGGGGDLPPATPTPRASPEVSPDIIATPVPTPAATPAQRWNPGWIGGTCDHDDACEYEGAFCQMPEEGFPGGHCSLGCDRFCPDREGEDYTVTFCVEEPGRQSGMCVARCDYGRSQSGCREGYVCSFLPRFNEAAVERAACLPAGDGAPPIEVDGCLAELTRRGLSFEPLRLDAAHPEGAPQLTCHLDAPIRLAPEVGGVTYRYFQHDAPAPMRMACALGLALEQMSRILREYDIVEVEHMGTYNCRVISGTDTLSQHGLGLAIDIGALIGTDGQRYSVLEHWEHDTTAPQDPRAQLLYELAQRLHTERVFNVVLTPNFNAAHDNHFHVDLTAGSHSIRDAQGAWYIGPNLSGD